MSANKLESLPAAGLSEDGAGSLEELYATNNCLTEKCVPLLTGHGRLRVLHLAFNQLQTFTARYDPGGQHTDGRRRLKGRRAFNRPACQDGGRDVGRVRVPPLGWRNIMRV